MKCIEFIFIMGLSALAVTAAMVTLAAMGFDDITPYARCWYIVIWTPFIVLPNYLLGLLCGTLARIPSTIVRCTAVLLGVFFIYLDFRLGIREGFFPLIMGCMAGCFSESRFARWLSQP